MEPQIRFKGFQGEWEKHSLGELGTVSMCRRIFKDQTTEEGDIPFYKIGTFGKAADAFISRELFEDFKARYPYPQKGNVLISAAGSIGRIVEYSGNDEYFQDSNIVWLNHDNRLNDSFLKYFYSVVKWSGLEGSTIKRLYNSNILETSIHTPSLPEQQLLGTFFSSLDRLLLAQEQKVAKLKQLKAASLQDIFPQEGKSVPKIRFKGFQGDWEKVKIESICKKESSSHSENSLGPNQGKFPIFGANGYLQNISKYDMATEYIGIIKDGSGVGRSQLYPAYSSILGTMQYILPIAGVQTEFLAYLFETLDLSEFVNGSSIPHIYFKDYCKINVYIPSKEEQKKIGRYFSSLDRQISLHTQRLAALQQVKSACLDKMFV